MASAGSASWQRQMKRWASATVRISTSSCPPLPVLPPENFPDSVVNVPPANWGQAFVFPRHFRCLKDRLRGTHCFPLRLCFERDVVVIYNDIRDPGLHRHRCVSS